MIKKICFSLIFVCMLIALPLALMGIHHVSVSGPFLAFLKGTNLELEQFRFEIPSIPNVPTPGETGGWWDVLGVLVSIANMFIGVCNLAISFMNVIIAIVQFVVIFVRRLIMFKDTLVGSETSNYVPPVV
ncbi:MAG: hypothetical protein J5666_06990 [Bacilli bacterium]|nr:hypothetical protein [Bacilli bacterium]